MARIVSSFRPPGRPAPAVAPGSVTQPYEAPAHLFASVTVESGGEAGLRARALSNHSGKPIAIHEIRVNPVFWTPLGGISTINVDPNAFMEVSLALDGKPITNGFVPMWLLGRSDNGWDETTLVPYASVANRNGSLGATTWRLPFPMIMPPGSSLSATVRHRGLITDAVLVNFGLVGRQIAGAVPRVRRLPYIAAWLATPREFNETSAEQSPETALWNATQRPLNVERITGRLLGSISGPNVLAAGDGFVGDFLATLLKVRMAFSTGQPIVRDLTPFGAVFSPGAGNTLELPFTLLPGEYLVAALSQTGRTGTVSVNWGSTYKVQAQMAISGWREE